MTANDVMGLISTVAISLPMIMMISTKLATYRTFPALFVYFLIILFHNFLTQGYISSSPRFIHNVGIFNNLMDAPLMLLFLSYFSTTAQLKNRMNLLVAGFVIFELVILAIFGYTVQAITITLGLGLALVLGFCIPLFVKHTKITITHHKASGKSFIIASLLFAYGCYTILYIMFYLAATPNTPDTFLVYFLVTTFSSLLMTYGIFSEQKRVKKLSELKIVRKELSELYPDEKMASPLRPAIFDFDKDNWN